MPKCSHYGQPLPAEKFNFDWTRQLVSVWNDPIPLTMYETEILKYLYKNLGELCTRHAIEWHIWKGLDVDATREIRNHISRMRKKFEGTGIEIHTMNGSVWRGDGQGGGYYLEVS